ncbi:hypothetical protein JQX13_45375 [Archangium violaceum]|uniref:hypothetical protein n=1 Tax=Archangium violaceum TaxID=83451 RepID=UPI00193B5219|nr:hypothetical protein [Archangium violaceum]QRK07204.1 hypothetical protein JQX13_45375 [Archangium violaceum]
MDVITLVDCSIALRSGTRIHCVTAAIIILLALGPRILPKLMGGPRPEPPPPDAPFQNTGSARRSDENWALVIALGAVFLIGTLIAWASSAD